jgi:hypothetical protein
MGIYGKGFIAGIALLMGNIAIGFIVAYILDTIIKRKNKKED